MSLRCRGNTQDAAFSAFSGKIVSNSLTFSRTRTLQSSSILTLMSIRDVGSTMSVPIMSFVGRWLPLPQPQCPAQRHSRHRLQQPPQLVPRRLSQRHRSQCQKALPTTCRSKVLKVLTRACRFSAGTPLVVCYVIFRKVSPPFPAGQFQRCEAQPCLSLTSRGPVRWPHRRPIPSPGRTCCCSAPELPCGW